MIRITIDISDLEAKIARLDIDGMKQAVGVAVGEEARARLAKYPAASGKAQPFQSAAQRRYFFAALRKGAINVPYRRTGQLGNRWMVEPKSDGALLINHAPYSDLVQSAKGQAGYHKGTWPTDEEVATALESEGRAQAVAGQVVEAALAKAGLS